MEFNEWLVGGGLLVGAIFGVLAQRFRFCMVSGISNWQLVGDYRQIMAFAAALLVAILGTQYLELSSTVAIETSSYRNSQFDWFGVIVGGLIFGVGGTMAGGCATRTVIKSGEGNLQSVVALMSFLVFAAITQFMFLEPVRLWLTATTAITLVGDAGLASVFGVPAWLPALLVVSGISAFLYRYKDRGISGPMLIAGAAIGALVVAGWYTTGVLAQDEFDPSKPSAITMSGPLARLGYMLLSGKVPALSFAVTFVIASFVFALISALLMREFRITAVPKGALLPTIAGGALMGIGGIMAYGCNVGQGLT
ncbi:MAG: YeeE/YedE family protein, partial [Gammaproteobacteria bacterium]|nr:YeeE/YedE family protein [Gammaproteobacteria bacterium]